MSEVGELIETSISEALSLPSADVADKTCEEVGKDENLNNLCNAENVGVNSQVSNAENVVLNIHIRNAENVEVNCQVSNTENVELYSQVSNSDKSLIAGSVKTENVSEDSLGYCKVPGLTLISSEYNDITTEDSETTFVSSNNGGSMEECAVDSSKDSNQIHIKEDVVKDEICSREEGNSRLENPSCEESTEIPEELAELAAIAQENKEELDRLREKAKDLVENLANAEEDTSAYKVAMMEMLEATQLLDPLPDWQLRLLNTKTSHRQTKQRQLQELLLRKFASTEEVFKLILRKTTRMKQKDKTKLERVKYFEEVQQAVMKAEKRITRLAVRNGYGEIPEDFEISLPDDEKELSDADMVTDESESGDVETNVSDSEEDEVISLTEPFSCWNELFKGAESEDLEPGQKAKFLVYMLESEKGTLNYFKALEEIIFATIPQPLSAMQKDILTRIKNNSKLSMKQKFLVKKFNSVKKVKKMIEKKSDKEVKKKQYMKMRRENPNWVDPRLLNRKDTSSFSWHRNPGNRWDNAGCRRGNSREWNNHANVWSNSTRVGRYWNQKNGPPSNRGQFPKLGPGHSQQPDMPPQPPVGTGFQQMPPLAHGSNNWFPPFYQNSGMEQRDFQPSFWNAQSYTMGMFSSWQNQQQPPRQDSSAWPTTSQENNTGKIILDDMVGPGSRLHGSSKGKRKELKKFYGSEFEPTWMDESAELSGRADCDPQEFGVWPSFRPRGRGKGCSRWRGGHNSSRGMTHRMGDKTASHTFTSSNFDSSLNIEEL